MDRDDRDALPVAVIGAGPVGLATAAHLVSRGETPLVLEAGDRVAAAVRRWAHVRVFSPWRYDVDPAAVALLRARGWVMPDPDHLPTGGELVDQYLEPLAALPGIRPHLRLGHRVLGVTREGRDKLRSDERDRAPFVLRVATAAGEADIRARAVVDASGTCETPMPLGAAGLPARGEAAARPHVLYGIPDVLGRERPRFAGRRVAVVGSGHSALNTLLDLAALAAAEPATRITWIVRRPPGPRVFGGGAADMLPARGALGQQARRLLERGAVTLVVGRIAAVTDTGRGIRLGGEAGEPLATADTIVAVTGFRPDLDLLRELRLDLDPIVEAPRALAPLIDPNLHSCGTVPPHGAIELAHPEPGFYVVGMKSYGRAPTFLLLTGYEQVRSVVAALTGDWAAAREVRLALPETGVCTGAPAAVEGCCGAASEAAVSWSPASCCGSHGDRTPAATGACCTPAADAVGTPAEPCCAPTGAAIETPGERCCGPEPAPAGPGEACCGAPARDGGAGDAGEREVGGPALLRITVPGPASCCRS